MLIDMKFTLLTLLQSFLSIILALPFDNNFHPPPNPFLYQSTNDLAIPKDPFAAEPSFSSARLHDTPVKSKQGKLILPPDGIPPPQTIRKIDASNWPTPPPIGSENKLAVKTENIIASSQNQENSEFLPNNEITTATVASAGKNEKSFSDKIRERFIVPPPIPTESNKANLKLSEKKTDVDTKAEHFGKDNLLIEHLTRQDRFAKLYERFSRIRRRRSITRNRRDAPFNAASVLEPNMAPGKWVQSAAPPKSLAPAVQDPSQSSLKPGDINGSLIATPVDPMGPLVSDPIRPSPLVSSWPNSNGKVVLGRGSPVTDVGEQKIYLPSHLKNRSELILSQSTALNESKIHLPQHGDIGKSVKNADRGISYNKKQPVSDLPSNGGQWAWSRQQNPATLPGQRGGKIFLPHHMEAAKQLSSAINN